MKPEPTTLHKACRVCGKLKPLSEFNKRSSSPDGHRNDCRDCSKDYRVTRKDTHNPGDSGAHRLMQYANMYNNQQPALDASLPQESTRGFVSGLICGAVVVAVITSIVVPCGGGR